MTTAPTAWPGARPAGLGRPFGQSGGLASDAPRTPARPGPGPTPEVLLRALDLTIGRRIRGLLPGEFAAVDRGGGTELAGVRPYEAGDDPRRIDWNVTARTTVPHVRVHVAERALTAWLVLDVSASMTFGTADRRKADVAEGVALALGHLATQRGNRLGLLTFGTTEVRHVPPAGGRRGLLAFLLAARRAAAAAEALDAADAAEPTGARAATVAGRLPSAAIGPSSSPATALRLAAAAVAREGLVVLVSDFRGPRDWLRPLAATAARHHVLAIEIRDPREDDLPDVGDLFLVDAETGRQVRVDTGSARLRERFARAAATERRDLAVRLRRAGADHVVLSTSGDWLRSLADQLRIRGLRS